MIKQNGNILLSLLLIVGLIGGGFYLYNAYFKPKHESISDITNQIIYKNPTPSYSPTPAPTQTQSGSSTSSPTPAPAVNNSGGHF